MRELPTGTVTFLFTDVEGSAQLVQQLRDGWPEVHAAHRRLLREAFAASEGREVDTQGDSFFVAFARARDAVVAAAAGQRALAAHEWPDGVRVRVRMGIHTGEPAVGEEGYLGLDVVRGARICAAGHGGQVLVSGTTRALVDWDGLDGISPLDLGEHRLKGIERAEPITQLLLAGLPGDFPPLRIGADGPSEPFAGRGDELAREASAAIRDLRASIERSVAASLRGVPGVDGLDLAQAIRQAQAPPPPRRRRALAVPLAVAALAALLVLVWLLLR